MPTCDDGNHDIPWKVTPNSLEIGDRQIAFDAGDVYAHLMTVMTSAGISDAIPSQKKVVMKSLCRQCWLAQAGLWGDVETYSAPRAKTDANALYFQVGAPDYLVEQKVSEDAVLSCVVHELMHYWSRDAKGVQDYNRRQNVDWDEAATDMVAYRVYKLLVTDSKRQYLTPYNQYPKSVDIAGDYTSTP